jgi:acyl-CoA reductase-like NAD-dependent aldehyde dehydrogenase
MSARLPVPKTYKLFIGGGFVRSESGRSLASPATGHNVPLASRKDLRDAVRHAHQAGPKWASRPGFNRGQILYRMAEMLDSRRPQFESLAAAEGSADPLLEVAAASDRLVHYAGWCDKLEQCLGTVNPLNGPYFGFTFPEPVGVVAVAVGPGAPLLALVSQLAPVLAGGNTAVVLAADAAPATACEFGEVLATSDLPAGVANVLCGSQAELLGQAAAHMEVDAIDVVGVEPSPELASAAAESVKRLHCRPAPDWGSPGAFGLAHVERFVEAKSVWHPVGV